MNSDTNFKVNPGTSIFLSWDFRDWKYMSLFNRFSMNITDPDIIAGKKEESILIDFSKMTKSDKKFGSRFVVGGRMFYEINLFATGFLSFTTNGFFDQLGYQEPLLENQDKKIEITIYSLVASLVCFCFCLYLCCKETETEISESKKGK